MERFGLAARSRGRSRQCARPQNVVKCTVLSDFGSQNEHFAEQNLSRRGSENAGFSGGAALRAHCPYIAEALEQNFFPRISKTGCSAPQLPDGLANRGQLSVRRYIPIMSGFEFSVERSRMRNRI